MGGRAHYREGAPHFVPVLGLNVVRTDFYAVRPGGAGEMDDVLLSAGHKAESVDGQLKPRGGPQPACMRPLSTPQFFNEFSMYKATNAALERKKGPVGIGLELNRRIQCTTRLTDEVN